MSRRARRLSTASLVFFAIGCGAVVQSPGWAQTSNYLLVRSLAAGHADIDSHHWQTGDKSWYRGHFYSVKAPGLPLLLVPEYLAFKAVGVDVGQVRHVTTRGAVARARGPVARPGWAIKEIHRERWMIWVLGLFGNVLPATGILFLLRSDADRIAAGTGTATAIAVGLGTLLLPFSTQLFGHAMGAFFVYLAFHLLMRERRGSPSWRLLAAAGLSAGFAITVEYPMAFASAVIGIYAIARLPLPPIAAAKRAIAFGGGALTGLLPLLLYNIWAFGSATHLSYADAVAKEGRSGHAVLGLNDSGFFGIGLPKPIALIDILLSPRGLITVTPICVLGIVGLVIASLRRNADALGALGVVLFYLFYLSGYWLPFGGSAPGPRFLVVAMPFAGLGLPLAWRRWPSATAALAAAGASVMAVATVAKPLAKASEVQLWGDRLLGAAYFKSVFTALGMPIGEASAVPVLLIWIAAAILAGCVTRISGFGSGRDLRAAAAALALWLMLAMGLSRAIGEHSWDGMPPASHLPGALVAVAAACAAAAVLVPLAASKLRAGDSPDRPGG